MSSGKESLKMPLNQAQLDILKLLSRGLDDHDLKEIKRLIVTYLADKLDNITGRKGIHCF